MKEIGGYFELEETRSSDNIDISILDLWGKQTPDNSPILLNSGRHALEYILNYSIYRFKTIWIPYYTCDSILPSINRAGLSYKFYHINKSFEIIELPHLHPDECILVNNYFGLKDKYISSLANKYGSQLIVDNTQAWYAQPILGISTFYSPRKYFGLPDGGVALTRTHETVKLDPGTSWHRSSHLLKRIDTGATSGYKDFKLNSSTIGLEGITKMSPLTKMLLSSIDFDKAREIRKNNYSIISDALSESNELLLPDIESYACPMVYPYLTSNYELRQELISNKIYVATYWPNVLEWCSPEKVECYLTNDLIPIPIDQRYGEDDMNRIISIIR